MSRLHKDSTTPSVASTSQEGQENRTLKVTFLSSEWKSSTDGDLATINRELAIQLAKHSNVDVSVLLPNCSEEDRSSAESHNVKLIEADGVPGLKPIFCLSSPPRNHIMDCVIGHGVYLGQQIALIKGNPHYCHCKWIQVVHSAPGEGEMYKNISEGERMQQTEIELCKMADQVVIIGPKLAEVYKHCLSRGKRRQNIFYLTPSIFSEFLKVEQSTEERRTFCVLVIGSGDSHEDFNVKGYDIAAKAIAELKDESYKLRFICPPGGKGDEMAEKVLRHGISRNQLIVRSFNDSREVLANLFCEVDLAIMPSRTEGFGITALEALSAGLPILVSGNSGLGEALKEVPLGSLCVVDSEDPKDWAKEIKNVCQKKREVRLKESMFIRANYLEKYSWEEPCRSLVERMYKLAFVTGGIPSYVLVGGPSVLKAYQRGLEFGKTYDKRTKILLIGQDRVGKTSLRKHLQGVKFDRDETSTSGVEMMPAVKNAAKQAWKNPASFESTSAFHHKCAELINKELSRSSPEKSHSARQLRGEDDIPNKESGTEEPRGDGLTPIVDTESTKDMKKRQGHEHKAEPMPRKVSSLANSGSTTPIQSKVTIK